MCVCIFGPVSQKTKPNQTKELPPFTPKQHQQMTDFWQDNQSTKNDNRPH